MVKLSFKYCKGCDNTDRCFQDDDDVTKGVLTLMGLFMGLAIIMRLILGA